MIEDEVWGRSWEGVKGRSLRKVWEVNILKAKNWDAYQLSFSYNEDRHNSNPQPAIQQDFSKWHCYGQNWRYRILVHKVDQLSNSGLQCSLSNWLCISFVYVEKRGERGWEGQSEVCRLLSIRDLYVRSGISKKISYHVITFNRVSSAYKTHAVHTEDAIKYSQGKRTCIFNITNTVTSRGGVATYPSSFSRRTCTSGCCPIIPKPSFNATNTIGVIWRLCWNKMLDIDQ
jgi:hypothetical protein